MKDRRNQLKEKNEDSNSSHPHYREHNIIDPAQLVDQSNLALEELQAEIEQHRDSPSADDDKQGLRKKMMELLAEICMLRRQLNAYSERLLAYAQHKEQRFNDEFVMLDKTG